VTLALLFILLLVANFAVGFACGCWYIVHWRQKQLEQRGEEIDPLDFLRRAEAIQLRMSEVRSRCDRAAIDGDVDTMNACVREADLLLDNLRQLRLEQIAAEGNGYRGAFSEGGVVPPTMPDQ
jgi:hypothetical protein